MLIDAFTINANDRYRSVGLKSFLKTACPVQALGLQWTTLETGSLAHLCPHSYYRLLGHVQEYMVPTLSSYFHRVMHVL